MEAVSKYLLKIFIDGKWVDTVKGETFDTYRPTNGEVSLISRSSILDIFGSYTFSLSGFGNLCKRYS